MRQRVSDHHIPREHHPIPSAASPVLAVEPNFSPKPDFVEGSRPVAVHSVFCASYSSGEGPNMKSFLMIIVSAVVALSSTATAQPFLEFTVTTSGSVGPNGVHNTIARFVVDASDPNQTVIPSTLFGSATNPSNELSNEPMELTIVDFFADITFLTISYIGSSPSQSISVEMELFIDVFSGFQLQDFDGSISDNPAAYMDWGLGISTTVLPGDQHDTQWSEQFGFSNDSDRFSISVREVPDPNPEPECIADLNNDGNLNFLDISKYLELYGDGCP
jgi:hypothetical protein